MPCESQRSPEVIALGEPLVGFSAVEEDPLAAVLRFRAGGGDIAIAAEALMTKGTGTIASIPSGRPWTP